jgi:KaiC/GvpD/RAD55 family RecA-like ATPase
MPTRVLPANYMIKATALNAVMSGVHSEWTYKTLEQAYDGIIDFKVEILGGQAVSFMRARKMRNLSFDSAWHKLKVDDNFEITLE